MKQFLPLLLLLISPFISAQTYTNYFTGDTTDATVSPHGGICLMGGATENDEAMKWFLQSANGGDILVLRASGSDGYNNYLYSQLGISVNSVETIVFNQATAANDAYVQRRVEEAEAIWFAGGDQWDYISYWRNTPIDSIINIGLSQKNIVIGGTSAGMAIQGGFYFSAENGTITSNTALNNPYSFNLTVDSASFLKNDQLADVITDTHYDNPDRRGRHVVFLARILEDWGIEAKGIACEEYTAVCIDTNGIARVYGEYPQYDDAAYFIQTNCELNNRSPEDCSNGNPLTWNRNGLAVKTYKVPGTNQGNNYFNLNNWQTGSGGEWQDWYVDNGTLHTAPGDSINCGGSWIGSQKHKSMKIFPNPAYPGADISIEFQTDRNRHYQLFSATGKPLMQFEASGRTIKIKTSEIASGLYFLSVSSERSTICKKILIH